MKSAQSQDCIQPYFDIECLYLELLSLLSTMRVWMHLYGECLKAIKEVFYTIITRFEALHAQATNLNVTL